MGLNREAMKEPMRGLLSNEQSRSSFEEIKLKKDLWILSCLKMVWIRQLESENKPKKSPNVVCSKCSKGSKTGICADCIRMIIQEIEDILVNSK